MRILVTGGAGFIGSHVVDGYRAAGHEVAVVDDLSTGDRRNLEQHPDVLFHQMDIRSEKLKGVFEAFRPDVVNHHAAQANVPFSVDNPVADAEVNILGGLNLLRLAATHGVRKFVYISSGGAMYGEPDAASIPVKESAPVRPLSPYGASKGAFETWLGVFHRSFRLDYTVLRYGNIYGPRQGIREEGAVVAVFATRMAQGQPCVLDGGGAQTRDFIYVGDVARANMLASEPGRAAGRSLNIGTGQEVSIKTIFDTMARVVGYTQPPGSGPARKGDVVRIALDASLAREQLGWTAEMPLEDGLRATYEYFRDLGRPALADRLPADAHVVILAGGEGTRLWPLSRGRRPKQLLALASARSLVQQTVDRVLPLVPADRIMVVTEQSHADDLRAQLPGLPHANIVVEATRRNTAPALLLAALHIHARAPQATWASLHSDAYIGDDDEFRRTLAAILVAASAGEHLLTTGIRPQFPATGYGYIHQAEKLRDVLGYPVYRVHRFVEKPDLDTARQYVQSGEYLWNPGVFAWKNTALLDAFRRHQPAMYAVLTSVPLARVDEVYAGVAKESIDVAIMEPADNVATLPATFRWSDLGSWSELWEVLPRDGAGNAAGGAGRHIWEDTQNSLVIAEGGRTIATVGVRDLVIVDTPDAVFVCPRDRAQDVKLVVRRLQDEGARDLL